MTALLVSLRKKDTKLTKLLLNAGANVNNPSFRSWETDTALEAAVTNNDIEMVEHLLSIGADPEDSGALLQALSHGMPMIEKLLTAFTTRYRQGRRRSVIIMHLHCLVLR